MILTALPQDAPSESLDRIPYTPHPIQRVFHTCPADHILYGGAASGGKTIALTMAGILNCIEQPGYRAIYFRLTFDDLQQQIDDSRRFVPEGVAKYNITQHRWAFQPQPHPSDPDGPDRESFLNFRYLKTEADALGYFSREYDLIMFDEATQFTEKTIELLMTRNRTSLPNGWARMFFGSNPGGASHQYFLNHFVEPSGEDHDLIAYWDWAEVGLDGKPGRWIRYQPGKKGAVMPFTVWRPKPNELQLESGELPNTRCFIPATVDDNPHADKSYKARLMALSDKHLRNALLYGDWHIFAGQAFAAWNEEAHVRGDIEIQPWWRKWRSIDWGWSTSATCVLWHTYDDENDQVITYRELYVREVPDGRLCEMILAVSPKIEHIDFTAADPAIFSGQKNDRGQSRDQVFAEAGIPLMRAINNRQTGFQRVQEALDSHPARDTENPDKVIQNWVCTPDCYNLRRTIPRLIYDKTGQDIVTKNVEDDAYDCLRYGLLATPAYHAQAAPPPVIVYRPF